MSFKNDATDEKTDDDFFDHGSPVGLTLLLPVIIMLEHTQSWSRFHMDALITAQVFQLKEDFESTLKMAPENQDWSYKNRKLHDNDTLQMVGVKRHDIITCQRKVNRIAH